MLKNWFASYIIYTRIDVSKSDAGVQCAIGIFGLECAVVEWENHSLVNGQTCLIVTDVSWSAHKKCMFGVSIFN